MGKQKTFRGLPNGKIFVSEAILDGRWVGVIFRNQNDGNPEILSVIADPSQTEMRRLVDLEIANKAWETRQ